jgi:OOP family OmpA-OmpF porin
VNVHRLVIFLSGAFAVAGVSFGATAANGPRLIAHLEQEARESRDAALGKGIEASFVMANGWLTRHPVLSGGEGLSDTVRARAAAAIAATPGVGGVSWKTSGGTGQGQAEASAQPVSLHCQEDVEAILRVRTIRFAEASALIDRASQRVLDEVAAALLPCVGSIIAVTGHTDGNGDETANLALSRARADAVRWALIGRGIPADGLRATGLGSKEPLKGLAPEDPANRRIDFSVIEMMPLQPTPIDTPGPG